MKKRPPYFKDLGRAFIIKITLLIILSLFFMGYRQIYKKHDKIKEAPFLKHTP